MTPAVRPVPRPEPRPSVLRGIFVEHLGLKILAALLTATVFLLVGTDEQREITARVGVAYVLPDGKVLVSERVDEIKVTIKGPWRRIKRFDERELDRITLDVSKVRGGEVPILIDQIRVPDGLTVTSVAPQAVLVAFENRIEREVEVAPSLSGRPVLGYAVVAGEIRVDPRRVTVRGPEGVVAAMSQVRTQDIPVDGRSRSTAVCCVLTGHGQFVSWGSRGVAPSYHALHLRRELLTRSDSVVCELSPKHGRRRKRLRVVLRELKPSIEISHTVVARSN